MFYRETDGEVYTAAINDCVTDAVFSLCVCQACLNSRTYHENYLDINSISSRTVPAAASCQLQHCEL